MTPTSCASMALSMADAQAAAIRGLLEARTRAGSAMAVEHAHLSAADAAERLRDLGADHVGVAAVGRAAFDAHYAGALRRGDSTALLRLVARGVAHRTVDLADSAPAMEDLLDALVREGRRRAVDDRLERGERLCALALTVSALLAAEADAGLLAVAAPAG